MINSLHLHLRIIWFLHCPLRKIVSPEKNLQRHEIVINVGIFGDYLKVRYYSKFMVFVIVTLDWKMMLRLNSIMEGTGSIIKKCFASKGKLLSDSRAFEFVTLDSLCCRAHFVEIIWHCVF